MNIFKRLFKPVETQYVELKPTESILDLEKKYCTRCKKWMVRSHFNKSNRAPDGLQYWCRSCQSNFEKQSVEKPKKNAKKMVKLPATNFEKPFLQLNVPNVSQAQYRQLVEIAKARKWPMERLYRQMVADFLTLNSK